MVHGHLNTPKDSEWNAEFKALWQGSLAEFKALRQEIERRSKIQYNLFALQLTTAGVIFSFALSGGHSNRSALLLIIPVSSWMLCAEYVDQIYGQRIAGKYIREQLNMRCVPGALGWEEWLCRNYPCHVDHAFKLLFGLGHDWDLEERVRDSDRKERDLNPRKRPLTSKELAARVRQERAFLSSPIRRFYAWVATFALTAVGALICAAFAAVWPVPRPAGYTGYVWYLIMAWILDAVFTFWTALMISHVRP